MARIIQHGRRERHQAGTSLVSGGWRQQSRMTFPVETLADLPGKAVIVGNQFGEGLGLCGQVDQQRPAVHQVDGPFPDDRPTVALDPGFLSHHVEGGFVDGGIQCEGPVPDAIGAVAEKDLVQTRINEGIEA